MASNYTGKYRYEQETTINVANDLPNPTKVILVDDGLSSYMTVSPTIKVDTTMKFRTIKLVRKYNIKKKYTVETNIKISTYTSNDNNEEFNYKVALLSKLPWNAIVGFTSLEKYEITYNLEVTNPGGVI